MLCHLTCLHDNCEKTKPHLVYATVIRYALHVPDRKKTKTLCIIREPSPNRNILSNTDPLPPQPKSLEPHSCKLLAPSRKKHTFFLWHLEYRHQQGCEDPHRWDSMWKIVLFPPMTIWSRLTIMSVSLFSPPSPLNTCSIFHFEYLVFSKGWYSSKHDK